MAKIRAVVKLPGKIPVVMLINGTYAGLGSLVGKFFEHIELSKELAAVVDGESMQYRMGKNARIMGKQLYGPVVIVRQVNGIYESLTDEEAEQIRRMIKPT